MKAVAEDEKEYLAEKEAAEGTPRERLRAPVEPVGLGIQERLEKEQERAEEIPSTAVPTVNVYTNSSSGFIPDVKMLATYILKGPRWDQGERLRMTEKMLHDLVNDPAERERLTKQLNDEIAKDEHKPKITNSTMFDKLKSLVKP